MQIIPVIDLKGGVVVRARHGDRAAYRPIATPLSPTSEALDVVAGLLALNLFRTLYIADLDAIEGSGDGSAIVQLIQGGFPHLELWVDNGCRERAAADAFLREHPTATLVLGSESQADSGLISGLARHPRIVLSLDFRGDAFLGPHALSADPEFWPQRLILMTLARVGSAAGPDFKRFRALQDRAGGRRIYLAGGLRDAADLAAVDACGAAGILVASALHDGRLSSAELAAYG